ncbi:Sensor protein FixL [Adhaeretor mobilis]|uniref:histidine kinase n=2 Tax=Adhaeretor mobilis TaxID=1930276 RepID=A0A517MZ34_9BACT|nr:Sensor protein FixL [Adhaeretor mobilis]
MIEIMSQASPEFEARLESAKLDAMKELAYGASHEINNPLANISARAQALLRDEQDPDRRRTIEAINEQSLRAHEMISDLMLFSRPPALEYTEVDLAALIKQSADEAKEVLQLHEVGIELVVKAEPSTIQADRSQLLIAIGALVRNSLEAIGTAGNIKLSARIEKEQAKVLVEDDGPGIPPEIREHMFEPFYSGREAGRGLGFGLSKCWRIVSEHGGIIKVESPEAGGAIFSISLPTKQKTR